MRLGGTVIAFLLGASIARGEPFLPAPPSVVAPTPAKVVAPSVKRRAAQGLGVASLALVVGGSASFGVALARYREVSGSDGCGRHGGCTAAELVPGKLAQGFGWGLVGAGVAVGAVALLLAWSDGTDGEKRLALTTGPGGLAVSGKF